MANGINVQLKKATDEWLGQIRNQLVASAAPAAPPTSGWVSAKPTASDYPKDALGRLDEFIKALNDASVVEERARNVGRLALQMQTCKSIVEDLDTRHKFDTITLVRPGKTPLNFRRIRECVELASRYYERLAYYQTRKGKEFLKGVTSVRLDLDQEGDVAVRDHHFDEQIDPLASIRHWDFRSEYVEFAQKRLLEKSDPLDHIVDFLIRKTESDSTLMHDLLRGQSHLEQARLHPTKSVGKFLNVQVLTNVPGDDRFSDPGPPRMWTYQVKVAQQTSTSASGGWVWSTAAWSEAAISLPILRVVHTADRANGRPGISDDFTRGTLYAMKGTTAMRCFPSHKFHSALFDSEKTSAAGMLVAQDGRVVAIDNRSGHYQPGYQQLQTAVDFLQANLLFESAAFVSVYVTSSDALYFEPADFLQAARRHMNYRVVAELVAKRIKDYGHLPVPVAQRYADLIPRALTDFPIHRGSNRWDRMLAKYYGGDRGLEAVVNDLKAALRLATSGNTSGWVSGHLDMDRMAEHASLANRTLKAIEAGGAYCHLASLVEKLMIATQLGEKHQRSLLEANVRYRSIMERLSTLTPQRGYF